MKDRIKWVEFSGKKILFVDYSNVNEDQFIEGIEEQEKESENAEGKTVLHLMDFTNAPMKKPAQKRADEMMANLQAKSFSVQSACFGITGLQRIIASMVKKDIFFAKHKLEALEWLSKTEDKDTK